MNILRKRAQKVETKNTTMLHSMTTFRNPALKIEASFSPTIGV